MATPHGAYPINNSPKMMHKSLHEWVNVGSFFAKSIQNWVKSFDGAFLFSCKCIFINKDWENSWGFPWFPRILVEKVDDFRLDLTYYLG